MPASNPDPPPKQADPSQDSEEALYDVSGLVDQIDNLLSLVPSSKTREELASMYDSLSLAVKVADTKRSVAAFINLFGCINVLVKSSTLEDENTSMFERSMELIESFKDAITKSVYQEYKKALKENYNAYRARVIANELRMRQSQKRRR